MANGKPGRPKGLPKTGGRKKGTPNKATAPIREAINAKDPIGRLFEIAEELRGEDEWEAEAKVLTAVLPYAYPRLAASQIDLGEAIKMGGSLKINFKADKD